MWRVSYPHRNGARLAWIATFAVVLVPMRYAVTRRPLTIADLTVTDGEVEPMVHDLKLAEASGTDRPRDIRKISKRNLEEIE
jgi:hypothetical protein